MVIVGLLEKERRTHEAVLPLLRGPPLLGGFSPLLPTGHWDQQLDPCGIGSMFLFFLMLVLLQFSMLLVSEAQRNINVMGEKQIDRLKIASLNVNGLNNPIKRGKVRTKFKKEKTQVIYLQETHLSCQEHQKLKKLGFRNTYYSSFKGASKRGVAILISKIKI